MDKVNRDVAFAAICMMEELLQYGPDHPYKWAQDVQEHEGVVALRCHLLDIAASADEIYMKIYDQGDAHWDYIAFDFDYIPKFMELAVDENGRVRPDAAEIMDKWRIEYQRRFEDA